MIWGKSKHKFLRPKEGPSKQTKNAHGYWSAGDGGVGGAFTKMERNRNARREHGHVLFTPQVKTFPTQKRTCLRKEIVLLPYSFTCHVKVMAYERKKYICLGPMLCKMK